MKIHYFLLALISMCSITAMSQDMKLTYDDCQNFDKYVKIKNGTELSEYVAKDGSVIHVGDTIVMGVPSSKKSVTAGVGAGDKVFGAVAETKTNAKFDQIQFGKPASFGAIMAASSGVDVDRPGVDMQGEQVIVKKMYVTHKGSKKKPLAVTMYLGEVHGRAFGAYKHMSTNDYEKASLVGELRTLNTPMTRAEAIAKLKEQKELLDLQIITQEDFDAQKEKLQKIILDK